ncbi:hypothetical protein JRO89_XS08G0190000 [Xanthoceras sorbifolium]|uniref:TF-B3 domain-containing protein n=1 Tax=Xanthoceras sorbifolium TaxID=99658 RepID=A0ABQ8HQK9_9ROSI|nr:hypothetical protein JRO89_XS08G0190000 [Xanthoceras sorbifolium]
MKKMESLHRYKLRIPQQLIKFNAVPILQSKKQQSDEEVTLAELSTAPASKPKRRRKPKRIYSSDEQVNATNNREKIILKIRKSPESTPKHTAIDGKCAHEEVKSPAMIRAEEVQSNLEPMLPSFAKSMVRSHVASCFWMGLPGQFCKLYLPNKDATVTLEDENGEQYEAKYFADKTGLSAGWRQFSIGHNLLEGDVLVFQLVGTLKFKVYIIKANDFTEVDGALGLLNLDAHTKQKDAGKLVNTFKKIMQKWAYLRKLQRGNVISLSH